MVGAISGNGSGASSLAIAARARPRSSRVDVRALLTTRFLCGRPVGGTGVVGECTAGNAEGEAGRPRIPFTRRGRVMRRDRPELVGPPQEPSDRAEGSGRKGAGIGDVAPGDLEPSADD